MLSLPKIPQGSLDIRTIDWSGLPKRFLNPGELEALIALVRSVQPKSILEIGVNSGRTAKAILDNVPGIETYQGVDVLPGYVPEKSVQAGERVDNPGSLAASDPRFHLILKARGTFDLTVADLLPADVIFIDGDHGRAAVTHDTELARALVKPGGVIIWHDYHDLGTVDVRDVLHEFAASGEEIFHVDNTWIAYQYQRDLKI
jgi:predicted O-methyltransferase YrrM